MRRRLAAAWDRFWFAPIDPAVIATFRVVLGVYLLLLLISLVSNWRLYHGLDGMGSYGDPLIQQRPEDWWSLIVWTRAFVPVELFWIATFVAALAFTLGWRAHVAAVVLFVLHMSAVHSAPATSNGEDQVLRGLLFCACFLRFDARRDLQPWPERWPLRMMQIFTCLIYVFTQVNKIVWEELWRNGEVMYLLSRSYVWGRFPWPLPELFGHWWATAAATWGSLAVELGFPILVWVPRLRVPIMALLAILHVLIAICIVGASFFNLAMLVCLCAFLTGEDLAWLRARVPRRRRAVAKAEAVTSDQRQLARR